MVETFPLILCLNEIRLRDIDAKIIGSQKPGDSIQNRKRSVVRAVNDVSYHIDEQEIVGVVGESGCGKSVTQLSIMRLINAPGKDCRRANPF